MKTAKVSFEKWMKTVDMLVRSLAGFSVHDLPDCCFADWYEDGVKPLTAAKRAIKAANE